MEPLSKRIDETVVAPGSVALWWLGQAGFALKTVGGTRIFFDPYLSNAVFRTDGFRRLSLAPIEADEVRADLYVVSHEHTDHLDPDAVPVVAANNPDCLFAAPSGCLEGLARAGVSKDRIAVLVPGESRVHGDTTVYVGNADHGHLSPTAVSVLLDCAGVRVMMSGDTSWRSDFFTPMYSRGIDLLIPCINGCFGNMGHLDAARMAAESGAHTAIPCHFWMFAEHGAADPLGFLNACKRFAPTVRAMVVSPGETLLVEGRRSVHEGRP